MTKYKYTREMLAEAALQSLSIAGVLRALEIRWSGGSHAHISRQLKKFGIDTEHFTGGAHNRGGSSHSRQPADKLLVELPADSRRTPGSLLRRALQEVGALMRCEICGNGGVWAGEPLTLHVDHINGNYLDNRRHNLRLLCPNCHSQTPTYAGRNRGVFGTITTFGLTSNAAEANATGHITAEELAAILMRVDAGEMAAGEAAKVIGCATDHINTMRRRLTDTGPGASHESIQSVLAYRDAVIAYALAHPERGVLAITNALRDGNGEALPIGSVAVRNILRAAGLHTPAARRRAASEGTGVGPTV